MMDDHDNLNLNLNLGSKSLTLKVYAIYNEQQHYVMFELVSIQQLY